MDNQTTNDCIFRDTLIEQSTVWQSVHICDFVITCSYLLLYSQPCTHAHIHTHTHTHAHTHKHTTHTTHARTRTHAHTHTTYTHTHTTHKHYTHAHLLHLVPLNADLNLQYSHTDGCDHDNMTTAHWQHTHLSMILKLSITILTHVVFAAGATGGSHYTTSNICCKLYWLYEYKLTLSS